MIGIREFHHVSFTVTNIEESVTFYEDLLGMKPLFISDRDTAFSETVTAVKDARLRIAYLEGFGVKLELLQYLSPMKIQEELKSRNLGFTHISFLVDDLHEIFAKLKRRDVQFRSKPVEIPTGGMKGGYTILLNDPDGNGIELIQPPKKTQT